MNTTKVTQTLTFADKYVLTKQGNELRIKTLAEDAQEGSEYTLKLNPANPYTLSSLIGISGSQATGLISAAHSRDLTDAELTGWIAFHDFIYTLTKHKLTQEDVDSFASFGISL